MPITLPFKQVDVFTEALFKGNPVAVTNCLSVNESDITTEQLQAIATWTNLSETTFIFKATDKDADYKLRIFTPVYELPFAGHPTIGSCKAFIEFTGSSSKKLVQQCGIGNVELNISEKGKISFKTDQAFVEDITPEATKEYEAVLHLKYSQGPKLVRAGPNWVVCLVEDSEACLKTNPDFTQLRAVSEKYNHTGVIVGGIKKGGSSTDYEIRAFVPAVEVNEDPVCGSGSLAFLRYMHDLNQFKETTKFELTQGSRVGRAGEISGTIEITGKDAFYHVAGSAISIINGTIDL